MTHSSTARIGHLVELGRWAEAKREAGVALGEEPDQPRLLGHLARAQLGLDETDEALATAERLVATAPSSDGAHRLRALALARAGRHEEAVDAAREAVRLAPHSAGAHADLALRAAPLRRHRTEAARAAAEAVRLSPEDPDAHFAAAYVASARHRRRAARAAYRTVLALEPEHAAARNNLALLRWYAGGKAAGLRDTLRIDPQHRPAQLNLVALLGRLSLLVYVTAAVALILLIPIAVVNPTPLHATVVIATAYLIALATLAVRTLVVLRQVPIAGWGALFRGQDLVGAMILNGVLILLATALVVLLGYTSVGHGLVKHTVAPICAIVFVALLHRGRRRHGGGR